MRYIVPLEGCRGARVGSGSALTASAQLGLHGLRGGSRDRSTPAGRPRAFARSSVRAIVNRQTVCRDGRDDSSASYCYSAPPTLSADVGFRGCCAPAPRLAFVSRRLLLRRSIVSSSPVMAGWGGRGDRGGWTGGGRAGWDETGADEAPAAPEAAAPTPATRTRPGALELLHDGADAVAATAVADPGTVTLVVTEQPAPAPAVTVQPSPALVHASSPALTSRAAQYVRRPLPADRPGLSSLLCESLQARRPSSAASLRRSL